VLALLPPEIDANDSTAHQLQKSHVIILSLLSFGSRIVTGLLADLGATYRISKTFWAIFAASLMAIAFFMGFGIESMNQLYLVTLFCGIAYGTVWTVVPILVGQYFGLVSFAKNWYLTFIQGLDDYDTCFWWIRILQLICNCL
jgi:MFS family permease